MQPQANQVGQNKNHARRSSTMVRCNKHTRAVGEARSWWQMNSDLIAPTFERKHLLPSRLCFLWAIRRSAVRSPTCCRTPCSPQVRPSGSTATRTKRSFHLLHAAEMSVGRAAIAALGSKSPIFGSTAESCPSALVWMHFAIRNVKVVAQIHRACAHARTW